MPVPAPFAVHCHDTIRKAPSLSNATPVELPMLTMPFEKVMSRLTVVALLKVTEPVVFNRLHQR